MRTPSLSAMILLIRSFNSGIRTLSIETITIHNNCISGVSLLKFEFFAIIISKAQNSAAKNAKKSPNKLEELIIRPLSFLETDITTPEKAKINPSSLIKESFSLFFVKKSKIVNQSGIE